MPRSLFSKMYQSNKIISLNLFNVCVQINNSEIYHFTYFFRGRKERDYLSSGKMLLVKSLQIWHQWWFEIASLEEFCNSLAVYFNVRFFLLVLLGKEVVEELPKSCKIDIVHITVGKLILLRVAWHKGLVKMLLVLVSCSLFPSFPVSWND